MPPTSDENLDPASEKRCSQSKCKVKLSVGYKYKTCEKCRNTSKLSMQKKRKREQDDEGPQQPRRVALQPATALNARDRAPVTPVEYIYVGSEEDLTSDENDENAPVVFKDYDTMMMRLKMVFKTEERVFFHGCCDLPADPLISEKECVKMTAHDVWKVTGYRFRVKENKTLTTGHKTRYWCCQDKDRKQKSRPSQREGARHRDTLGMHRYECKSKMNISCRTTKHEDTRTVTIWLEHHKKHTPYYDVSLPPEATAMIRENLEWTSPSEIAKKVQGAYPAVSANQVHKAWTTMSETLWKRDAEQLSSVIALLKEYKDDVDALDIPMADGIEQIAWVMKKISGPLTGKIVEIGIDATYNTNSRHLELYTVLGEFDNSGFPLSYCLLSTASSIDDGKRTKALESWAKILRDKYELIPKFIHTDKDMAEIGTSRRIWPKSKHQLCWWHQREALKRRLKGNLPTSAYNGPRAKQEYHFIDPDFKPYGRTDPKDREGNVAGEEHEPRSWNDEVGPTEGDPNAIKVRIPARQGHIKNTEPTTPEPTTLKIRIPALSTLQEADPTMEDESDEESTNGRRTFCPLEYRAVVIEMTERHFCAHPLIPGYSAPTPDGIKAWAVKQIYEFCTIHDLPNLWAYLWENWYRRGRWELWARSSNPEEIPRLKTTMIVEAHWRRVKEDFLHHFSLPRLDLLVWVLITKLAPSYYRKLDIMLHDIGRFRELPKWRKEFKSEWKKAMKTPITMPLNEKYRPDPKRFVCTCPQFVISRFLICKHLVQLFHPVNPIFFLEVTRNRTTPFWSHPTLKPLVNVEDEMEPPNDPAQADANDGSSSNTLKSAYIRQNTAGNDFDDVDDESDDDLLVDMSEDGSDMKKTCKEEMMAHIQLIQDFCDGLKYQVQFQDLRFLKTLEKEGVGFFRLARNCLSRERRLNSSRAASPTTWESSTANALFYRSRPRHGRDS